MAAIWAFVFFASWILGCVIFDGILNLNGGWLMLGGAVTYNVAKWAAEGISGWRG